MNEIDRSLQEQNAAEQIAGNRSKQVMAAAAKEGVKTAVKSGAGAGIKAAGAAVGGIPGLAAHFAISLFTTPTGKKILMGFVCLLLFLVVLLESLPALIFNSIFHINKWNSPLPDTDELIHAHLFDTSIVFEQEVSVMNVMKNVFSEAYNDALKDIPNMCSSLEGNIELELSLANMIDNSATSNDYILSYNSGSSDNLPTETNSATYSINFADEYGFAALSAAYSISINQMEPLTDENGNHLSQLYEEDKDCKQDIEKRLRAYYKQKKEDNKHGNLIYRISYIGEEENGTPTIFCHVVENTVTDEEGNEETVTEYHYYIKPVIHPFDVSEVCQGAFDIDFNAHYERGSQNTTVLDAVTTLSESYLSLLHNTYGEGDYIGAQLSAAEIAAILNSVKTQYPNLNAARMSIINIGLQSVGKIPYFICGHADAGPYLYKGWGRNKLQKYPGRFQTGKIIPYGLDCASYVGWLYAAAGICDDYMCTNVGEIYCGNHWNPPMFINESTYIGSYSNSSVPSELLPGDILVAQGHISLYVCQNETGMPMLINCRAGKGGGAVYEKATSSDTSGLSDYTYRRLPVDFDNISKTRTFPATLKSAGDSKYNRSIIKDKMSDTLHNSIDKANQAAENQQKHKK